MNVAANAGQVVRKRIINNDCVTRNNSENSINITKEGEAIISNCNNDYNSSCNKIKASKETAGRVKSIIDNSNGKCNKSVNVIND